MRIALAQINAMVGDLAGNVVRCLEAIEAAGRAGADLVVLPEMAVPGYPPRDILCDTSFVAAIAAANTDLALRAAGEPATIVGTVVPSGHTQPSHPALYNAALLLSGGEARLIAAKRLLPAYDVFYEPRWFLPGPAIPPVDVSESRLGVLICEDLWDDGYGVHPPAELLAAGADILVAISASPYRMHILPQRYAVARRPRAPVVYVNACGATDELIFDGRSFAVNADGEELLQLKGFEEDLQIVDIPLREAGAATGPSPHAHERHIPRQPYHPPKLVGAQHAAPSASCGNHDVSEPADCASTESTEPRDTSREPSSMPIEQPSGAAFASSDRPDDDTFYAELFQALTLGVRDFARKNRIPRAFLGLSGGVDSAVVAIIAAEALGPENVTAVAIPSRFSDPRSTTCAEALSRALGITFEVVELEPLHQAVEGHLGDLLVHGTAAENAQARLRALILMAYVNRYGGMLLNTSNKTELALGYGTLYGDLSGTLSPIGDLTKPDVYGLAHWLQAQRGCIPPFILERPPSAELKPDQVDPFDYPRIAPVLEDLVLANRSDGHLRRSEHKRWHMGVVLKVSEKAFGTGRLIPITRA